MLKSELIDCFESCRSMSLDFRDEIDSDGDPRKYGFRDGQAYAYGLILDALKRICIEDDLGSLQPMEIYLALKSRQRDSPEVSTSSPAFFRIDKSAAR